MWLFVASGIVNAQVQILSDGRVDTATDRDAPEQIETTEELERQVPFGANLFGTGMGAERDDGLNPEYEIQPGDRITLRLWGAVTVDDEAVVDGQGNIFVPNIGPISVAGVKNRDLNNHIGRAVGRVFTHNVDIYTNLQSTQPTVVFVTGYVPHPGSYAGVASDSVLYFLSRAGGVQLQQGSFRDVVVKRGNEIISRIDLYRFLLDGEIPKVQFRDGDAIVVGPRHNTVVVEGAARNTFTFEFFEQKLSGKSLLDLARPLSSATHATVFGTRSGHPESAYLRVDEVGGFLFSDGDQILFELDGHGKTMLIAIEGSHIGRSRFVVPRDTKLREVLDQVEIDPMLADTEAISIRRKSLAIRQSAAITASLNRLEAAVIGASSQTDEESQIRLREAELITAFAAQARDAEPEGILVVSANGSVANVTLEPDDVITVPALSQIVLVSGEIMVPQALVYDPRYSIADYIDKVGGFTDRANRKRILITHRSGEVVDANATKIRAGDEILVLPEVPVKNLQIAKSLTEIIFQIALATATAFNVIN